LPVTNRSRLFLYFYCRIFFLYFISGAVLWGQEAEYRLEEDGRFVQILRWRGSENARYYEAEIERPGISGWETVLHEKTGAAFCEVSLAPGTYRYRVRAYDLLGRPGAAAEWVQFEVLLAKQPELWYFTPEAISPEGNKKVIITLGGRNLTGEIKIYLQREGGEARRIPAETVTVNQTEDEVRAAFHSGALEPGNYTIWAVNPGGLNTSLGTFRNLLKNTRKFHVWAGYMPLVSLGNGNNTETGFFPPGGSGRLKFLPIMEDRSYLGIEVEASWNQLRIKKAGYDVRGELIGGAAYGIYQWWFLREAALNIRSGGGAYLFLDPHNTGPGGVEQRLTFFIPAIITGFSFQWTIKNSFFMEGGLDFTYPFNVDSPSRGYLRPFLGVGYYFGR
jgi:hypothetical protein